MEDRDTELGRLRARVEELEALEHRVAYAEAMARRLRRQAEEIAGSRTWRLLTGAGALLLKAAGKLHPPQPSASITPERYWRWIAHCERREAGFPEAGPRFGVIADDARTLASLAAQTYRNWASGEDGDYLVRPAPGDEFAPDALALMAGAAMRDGADMVYCDEDALDARGLRIDPWFKPDWSPDLMAASGYTGRACAVRRGIEASEAQRAAHLPRVLYHSRGGAPHRARRVRYPVPAGSRVEIIVPSRNPRLLARCLETLRARTGYEDYGLAVIDNSSGGEIASVAGRHGARVLDWRGRTFNYSAMNNAAAAETTAPLLLFLNDDTTVRESGWLEAMVEHAARPEVGAVGARLLYPDGRIQHAGVVIGIFGVCGHVFKGWPVGRPTYRGLAETVRNVSAVTGACMMVRADVFREAGGFEEKLFPVAYNDIDLCLRVLESGRRIVYTPHAALDHHEAFSKPWSQQDPETEEIRAFQARWRRYIEHDPFYNPNLTLADENYGLRSPGECG